MNGLLSDVSSLFLFLCVFAFVCLPYISIGTVVLLAIAYSFGASQKDLDELLITYPNRVTVALLLWPLTAVVFLMILPLCVVKDFFIDMPAKKLYTFFRCMFPER